MLSCDVLWYLARLVLLIFVNLGLDRDADGCFGW